MGNRLLRGAGRGQNRGQGSGVTPTDIADHNSRAVVGLLLRLKAMSRQELASRLGLTEQAVTGIMRRLMTTGLCRQIRPVAGRGKGAAKFTLVPDAAHAIGVSVRPTGGEMVRVDLTGRIVQRLTFSREDLVPELRRQAESGSRETLAGIGIACHPDSRAQSEDITETLGGVPTLITQDTEAILAAERLLGVGEPEGGLVVILIDETVRAGLLIGDRFFRGMHGRAGKIGAFGFGSRGGSLNEVIGAASFTACRSLKDEDALEAWICQAADRLLRAIVAIAGLVSPGVILIGGTLPAPIVEQIIARMTFIQRSQADHFVPAPWIAPIRPVTFTDVGIALGAATMPLIERYLPSLDRR